MIIKPGPLQEAEMKLEFRRLYREQGKAACLQVLYEIMKASEWLGEVMLEERAKEQGCGCTATEACDVHRGRIGFGL